ncbi:ER membrane protein complex subunit 10-like [Aricia agestis]|uniref:ER membrane protein complex subunit 10-like n=1 Tax=Aricia agestis TaxID=91739 RepID=UPI001C20905C|nr:ER membrane protein complex subunit 10-like [Aricia agestis]
MKKEMMQQYSVTVFFCLLSLAASLDYDGWLNVKIEHALHCNGNKFCSRGNISLKSLRAGVATIDQIQFNKQHITELKELAASDDFYTMRTLVTSADTKETEFFSSVKAAAFLESGLSDLISVWVLPCGEVIAVNFQVANSSKTDTQYRSPTYDINSKFYLRQVDQAPVPDTASYIQKLEREREAREKGEFKDNRSFLAKYWMYIVPIAIFVMISGAANPEAAQGAR